MVVGERGGWKGVDGKGDFREVVLKRAIPGRRRRMEKRLPIYKKS